MIEFLKDIIFASLLFPILLSLGIFIMTITLFIKEKINENRKKKL